MSRLIYLFYTPFFRSIKFFFLFSLISIFCACKNELIELITYPDVSQELCPFFQSFEEEAAKRGLVVDLKNSGVKGRLTNIYGSIVGICSNYSVKEILIDQNFWERSSQLSKELIVFHELGHCYLNKVHNNQVTANGTCGSIMRSGQGDCIDYYTEKTRVDLLDKFFSE